jgi:hypothetical protein
VNKPIPEWRWTMATRLCSIAEWLVKKACKIYYEDDAHWVVQCHEPKQEESKPNFISQDVLALIKGEIK